MSVLNDLISANSLYANIEAQINSALTNLRTATFCYVTKVDKRAGTLNCQPVVKESINSSNGVQFIQLPELINVPYTPTIPEEGDYCVCVHLDRSIGEILQKRKKLIKRRKPATTINELLKSVNSSGRKHALNDCIAITGIFKPKPQLTVDNIYPVGAIYISTIDKNPSELFEGTEWEKIEDKFLLASGTKNITGSFVYGGENTSSLILNVYMWKRTF